MYEPMGGSAPKYTGQGVINPLAAIASLSMMLTQEGYPTAGRRVDLAIRKVRALHICATRAPLLSRAAAGLHSARVSVGRADDGVDGRGQDGWIDVGDWRPRRCRAQRGVCVRRGGAMPEHGADRAGEGPTMRTRCEAYVSRICVARGTQASEWRGGVE